jgi:hypothetical protein
MITLKPCPIDGHLWKPFAVDFTNSDGTYSAYIMATSLEHALLIVGDLVESQLEIRELV